MKCFLTTYHPAYLAACDPAYPVLFFCKKILSISSLLEKCFHKLSRKPIAKDSDIAEVFDQSGRGLLSKI